MVDFWRMKTWQDGLVAVRLKDGQIMQVRPEVAHSGEYALVVAVSLPDFPNYLFLMSEGEMPFLWVSRLQLKGKILTLLASEAKDEPSFAVHLEDPIRPGGYFTAHPWEGKKANELLGDCKHAMGWEAFSLETYANPSPFLKKIGDGLAQLFRPEMSADDLLSFLKERHKEALRTKQKETLFKGELNFLLDACLPAMAWEEIGAFGKHLLSETALLDFLKEAEAAPVWVIEGLQNLERWKKHRNRKQKKKYITDLADSSVAVGEDSAFAGLLHAALHAVRRQTSSRFKSCLVTTVRNEGIYLLEWIAYHLSLGIDRIFLYSNGNVDGSSRLLELLHEQNIITYIENIVQPGVSPQFKAYGHALNIFPDVLDYEWCFIVDGDEFITLNPGKFSKINDYLAHMRRWEGEAIAFNWKMIASELCTEGMSALAKPLTERNQRIVGSGAIGEGWRLVKTAHRSGMALQSRAHHPISNPLTRFAYRTASGRPYDYVNPPPGFGRDASFADVECANTVYISHFYFKSMIEWTWKNSRNTGADPESTMGMERYQNFWANSFGLQLLDKHPHKDEWIKARSKETLKALADLRALPGIGEAENEIRQHVTEYLHRLVEKIKEANIAARISEEWRFLLGDLSLEVIGEIPLLPLDSDQKRQG